MHRDIPYWANKGTHKRFKQYKHQYNQRETMDKKISSAMIYPLLLLNRKGIFLSCDTQ